MANPDAIAVIDGVFSAAGVTQVVSIDDMYADDAPVDQVVGAAAALQLTEPGVCAVVFGETSGINFDGDSEVVESQVRDYWARINPAQQRDILQELRAKLNQEDDIDKATKSALADYFSKYGLKPFSRAQWEREKASVLAKGEPRTLILVDEDFSKESGGGDHDGLKIIKEIFVEGDPTNILCGLLSHGYDLDDIHKQWQELCNREGLDKSRFVLIPKRLLDDDIVGFVRLVKLAILNGPADKIKARAAEIIESARAKAEEQLANIDIYDFDHIVFRSSANEGVWEPDTLFRIFGLFHRDETRKLAKENKPLHELAAEIRKISDVPTHSVTAPSYNTWRIQRIELYEDSDYLNSHFAPIDLGDIFERTDGSGKKYILLTQSCDLMVRGDGERSRAVKEGMLAAILAGTRDPRSHAELQYFDETHLDSYFVSFKKIFAIKLLPLDLCALNVDGKSEFAVATECPPLVIPAWQNRFAIIAKAVKTMVAQYKKFISKSVETEVAGQIVTKCCNDEKINGKLLPNEGIVSYPLRRIGRLRQPRAAALLARYANFVAREAFDHDFGTVSEEKEEIAVAERKVEHDSNKG